MITTTMHSFPMLISPLSYLFYLSYVRKIGFCLWAIAVIFGLDWRVEVPATRYNKKKLLSHIPPLTLTELKCFGLALEVDT